MLFDRRFLLNIQIGSPVANGIFVKVIQIVGAVLTVSLINITMTSEEQGYYYTFNSLLAIQTLFDLGMTDLVIQFTSHENSFIKSKESSSDKIFYHTDRLASFFALTLRWFLVASLCLFIGLVIIGNWYFTQYGKNNVTVAWATPWLLIAFGTSLMLLLSALLAFFEGLGYINEVYKVKMYQQILQVSALTFFLYKNLSLYSAGFSVLVSALIFIFWIFSKRNIMYQLWKTKLVHKVNWKLEVIPYQRKLIVSWVFGYILYQTINPILFAVKGPDLAGKFGMTNSIITGVLQLPNLWIKTYISRFSELIAQSKFDIAYQKFFDRLKKSSSVFVTIAFVLILGFTTLYLFWETFYSRLMPFPVIIVLILNNYCNYLNFSFSSFLRCFKEELYLFNTVVSSMLVLFLFLLIAQYLSIFSIFFIYLCINVGSCIWGYKIFQFKKLSLQ